MPIPVFDIGGVLLDWDPRYLYRPLFKDDTAAMEAFLATVCTPDWNRSLDAGKPYEEGVAELIGQFPDHADLIRAYHDRWQDMIPRPFEDSVAILGELRALGRPLYAITNFSAEKFDLERRRWPFLGWFDGIVVSGEEGLLKPDPGIYRLLLDRHGLDAADCVFIDDVMANVDGARAVGMRAVQFVAPAGLRADLMALGLL